MKKILFLIAISLLAYKSNAQTEAGNFMIGGSVYFNSLKVSDDASKRIDFSVIPSAAYFISRNLAIGAGIGYRLSKYDANNGIEPAFSYTPVRIHQIYVTPFARYYLDLNEQFKVFGQFSVPISFGKTKTEDNTGRSTTTLTGHSYGFALSPGLAFFPNKRIGIELSVNGIGYVHNTSKDPNIDRSATNEQFSIDGDLFAPKLGIQFYF